MKIKNITIVEHKLIRKGVEVMYRDDASKNDDKKIWVRCGGLYGWHTVESAMNLAKAIIKMKSDLKKAGIKL